MKLNFLIISLAVLLGIGCKNSPDRPDPLLDPATTTATPTTPTTPTAEPPQNAAGVWHFTCPNGCAGGAGAKQPCAKCGTELAHNQAYHDNAGGATTQTVTSTNPQITPVTAPTNTAEPPQNAAGVWHFTCPNGCAGGAGAKQPCAKCGTELAHNQAYHN